MYSSSLPNYFTYKCSCQKYFTFFFAFLDMNSWIVFSLNVMKIRSTNFQLFLCSFQLLESSVHGLFSHCFLIKSATSCDDCFLSFGNSKWQENSNWLRTKRYWLQFSWNTLFVGKTLIAFVFSIIQRFLFTTIGCNIHLRFRDKKADLVTFSEYIRFKVNWINWKIRFLTDTLNLL